MEVRAVEIGEAMGKAGTLSLVVARPCAGRPMRRARWAWSSGSLVFGAEAGELDLRGGEAGAGEIDGGVLAGVEALLDDADETVGVALLIVGARLRAGGRGRARGR